jgi:AcrR family transcriptional regulator
MSPHKKTLLHPRKQPGQARSVDTVAAILEAAAHILEEDDYSQYSTNTIAKRAGVSIGSLYQYFPGKDAITIALIQQQGDEVTSDIEKAALIEDWRDAIRTMIVAAARSQLSRPALTRILDLEEARLQTDIGAAAIVSIVEAVLARGLGTTTRIDHHMLALDVVAITRGITDTTAKRKDLSMEALLKRLDCGVFGYLSFACPVSIGPSIRERCVDVHNYR